MSIATASLELLSSTPLAAAPLESSASFSSSSEGASSSCTSPPVSGTFESSAELTPVTPPEASISDSIEARIVCGTFPNVGGNNNPFAPIPMERLCPGPNKVELWAPLGVKAISPFNIEVTC